MLTGLECVKYNTIVMATISRNNCNPNKPTELEPRNDF